MPEEEVVVEGALLIPLEKYLEAGIHIGTQQKTGDMESFIYRVRSDGLYVLDVKKTDERIRAAGKLLSKYDSKTILAVSARQYGQKPVHKFAEIVGATVIPGRFVPGTLTNPSFKGFIEPEILLISDPRGDAQALEEAKQIGIPVIGLCDTNSSTANIDLIIPCNNKGRKALTLVYYLLARQIMRERNLIPVEAELSVPMEAFES